MKGEKKTLAISGNPRPQQRARARRAGPRIIMYDPQSAEKKAEKKLIRSQWEGNPLHGPLKVTITFFMKMPSWATKKDTCLIGWGVNKHVAKPDLDNLAKKILDECTGIVWDDDRQVVELNLKKEYSHNPRLEMEVSDVSVDFLDDTGAEILGILSEEKFLNMIDVIKDYALSSQRPSINRSEQLYCAAKAVSHLAEICGTEMVKIKKISRKYHKKTFEEVLSDQLAIKEQQ